MYVKELSKEVLWISVGQMAANFMSTYFYSLPSLLSNHNFLASNKATDVVYKRPNMKVAILTNVYYPWGNTHAAKVN